MGGKGDEGEGWGRSDGGKMKRKRTDGEEEKGEEEKGEEEREGTYSWIHVHQ